MDIRTVFMGSPDFALPSLKTLAAQYPVVGVVTQPDRPAGRGRVLTPPPVKLLAQELNIPVIQPERLSEPGAFEQLQDWRPELIVVAAFGQILRRNVLALPPFGCVNVHASLLPRWRGAAPIQHALLNGDELSGVTIMKMDAGVDTGPILSQRALELKADETAGSLSGRLADLGAQLLVETLPAYLKGELAPRQQEEEGATYAKMLQKEDGRLDFTQPVQLLERKVRAFDPWPGAFTRWQGNTLKILKAHAHTAEEAAPGSAAVIAGKPAIGAAGGWLVLDEVQPAGKKAMPGKVFLRGVRQWQFSFSRD